jgi:hypothetical protein
MAHYYPALSAIVLLIFTATNFLYDKIIPFVGKIESSGRKKGIAPVLLATSVLLFLFTIYYGNQQFGAFDDSILIDSGWRLVNGQLPYTAFMTPHPPGFLLGAGYAFRLFGVRWDSQLYAAGLFNVLTFLWIYLLFERLLDSCVAAWCAAFCIQCAATLPLCFWSHSSLTTVSASIFYLSCLLFLSEPDSRTAQISFSLSLFLLGLMKPNTALSLIVGGLVILFLFGPRKRRLALLTISAAGGILIFL